MRTPPTPKYNEGSQARGSAMRRLYDPDDAVLPDGSGEVETMAMVERAFDQRPEDEVRNERISRLFREHNRCGRCGGMIDVIQQADVAVLSNYPRLVHKDACPPSQASESARAAVRKVFPDADFSSHRGRFQRVRTTESL